MQDAQIFRNKAYLLVRRPARADARVGQGMTKDEAQRSRWTFYEVVTFDISSLSPLTFLNTVSYR